MRRNFLIIVLSFLCLAQFAQAQDPEREMQVATLKQIKNPYERFSKIISFLESSDTKLVADIDSAYCVDLLKIAKEQRNDSLLAISYNWIGYYFYLKQGDNRIALEYFFKALPLALKANDKRRISSIYFDIAGAFYFIDKGDYLAYTKKGGEHLPDPTSEKYNYMLIQYQRNMSISYLERNSLDSALSYALLASQAAEKTGLIIFKLQTLSNLGTIYSKKNEQELAAVYFKKARALSDQIKLRKDMLMRRYIPYLIEIKQLDSAKSELKEFWEAVTRAQNKNSILLASGLKRSVFDAEKNTDSAYFYTKIENQTREQIFATENQNIIKSLAFQEQLREIEDSAKKAEEEQIKRQNLQYFFISAGIVFFLLMFFLLSRSIIVNEKWISFFGILGLLIVFEFINLLIHPFLERITHHSPLLMLIALVALASLLIPIHHKLEKWIKEKMTEKNKRIRLENAKKTIEELGHKE